MIINEKRKRMHKDLYKLYKYNCKEMFRLEIEAVIEGGISRTNWVDFLSPYEVVDEISKITGDKSPSIDNLNTNKFYDSELMVVSNLLKCGKLLIVGNGESNISVRRG